jgi:hypothetical protein
MFPFDFLGSSSDDVDLDPINQSPDADPAAMYPESTVWINHGTGEVLSPGDVWVDNGEGIYVDSEDYVEGKNHLRVDPLTSQGQTNVTLYNAEELGHLSTYPNQAVSDDLAANEADSSHATSGVEANDEGNGYGDENSVDGVYNTPSTSDVYTVSNESFDSSSESSYSNYDMSASDWSSSNSSYDSLDSGWDSSSSDWSSDSDYESSSDW